MPTTSPRASSRRATRGREPGRRRVRELESVGPHRGSRSPRVPGNDCPSRPPPTPPAVSRRSPSVRGARTRARSRAAPMATRRRASPEPRLGCSRPIEARCTNAQVQTLDAMGTFGDGCSGATSTAGLATCEIAAARHGGGTLVSMLASASGPRLVTVTVSSGTNPPAGHAQRHRRGLERHRPLRKAGCAADHDGVRLQVRQCGGVRVDRHSHPHRRHLVCARAAVQRRERPVPADRHQLPLADR